MTPLRERTPAQAAATLRSLRRDAGLTQLALARQVGVSQPAISKFESGDHPGALAAPVLRRIATALGAAPDALGFRQPGPVPAEHALHMCPQPECPGNYPYRVADRVVFALTLTRARRAAPAHCAACGELLIDRCPHCEVDLEEGAACCRHCGSSYVTFEPRDREHADAWIASRRVEIERVGSAGGIREFSTRHRRVDDHARTRDA